MWCGSPGCREERRCRPDCTWLHYQDIDILCFLQLKSIWVREKDVKILKPTSNKLTLDSGVIQLVQPFWSHSAAVQWVLDLYSPGCHSPHCLVGMFWVSLPISSYAAAHIWSLSSGSHPDTEHPQQGQLKLLSVPFCHLQQQSMAGTSSTLLEIPKCLPPWVNVTHPDIHQMSAARLSFVWHLNVTDFSPKNLKPALPDPD